jgi:microcystin-dependent protein
MMPFHRPLLAAVFVLIPAASAQTTGGTGSPAPAAVDQLQPALALRAFFQSAGTFPGQGNGVPAAGSGATAYTGEIRWLAAAVPLADTCPEAAGAVLPISPNQAVFSLLGSNFGGDGESTFQLPDLRGRLAMAAGQGTGLSGYALGQTTGAETFTLATSQLPPHGHLLGTTVGGSSGNGAAIPNHQPTLTLRYLVNGDAELRLVTFQATPTGWAGSEGQLLANASYPGLFGLLGYTYGGNGSSQFRLPDLRGRVAVGRTSGTGLFPRTLGAAPGSETIVLTGGQIPEHDHTLPGGGKTGAVGGVVPIDKHQPGLVVTYGIAHTGAFPGQGSNPFVNANGLPVTGEVRAFARSSLPSGFLAADGSLVPISTYQALFSLLGTTFGGDGESTFALPDLRGRSPLGAGNGIGLTPRPLAQASGTDFHRLTAAELPLHAHSLAAPAETIANRSFEADLFTVAPGYATDNGGTISGWTFTGRPGLNPAGGSPFANNGLTPDGTQVAFLQSVSGGAGVTSLSTTLTGLATGSSYGVKFRANSRDYLGGVPQPSWTIDGGTPVAFSASPFVGAGNPYYTVTGVFTASGPTATLLVRNLAFGDHTLLVDDFRLSDGKGLPWSVTPWTDDASSGIDPGNTVWAYNFGSASGATINGVAVTGVTGATPSVAGRFSATGFTAVLNNDSNALTQAGGSGSAILARDYIHGGNPGIVTLAGLTPGRTYTATFPGVGAEAASSRVATFSGSFDSLAVDENRYGPDQGVLARLTFTATAASHAVRIAPRVAGTTYHLYGLALADHGITRYAGWRLAEFGADAGNAALAGEAADAEKDGLENLLEYAFDLDPGASDGSPLGPPLPVTLAGMFPGRRFTLPYRPAARDLDYVLQHGTDLAGWSEVARLRLPGPVITTSPGILLEPDPGAGLLRITLTDLALFPPPRFFRIAVVLGEGAGG